jgi:MFS family permease
MEVSRFYLTCFFFSHQGQTSTPFEIMGFGRISQASTRHSSHAATDRTPLLGSGRSEASRKRSASKPLPKWQIIILCYARLMEGIAFFSVFPYLPHMIQRNMHLSGSQVGFYTGLIESASSVAEVAALPLWFALSDRFGRKSALAWSLAGMAVGPVLFGLSTSIAEMLLFRCLAGFFSGSGLIIRTMIGEHTTPETQGVAYSWFSMADSLSSFIGPLLGGALADPVKHYPLFRGISFFRHYPYALPGIAIGAINAIGTVLCVIWLEETLDKREQGVDDTTNKRETMSARATFWRITTMPGFFAALWVFCQVWFTGSCFVSVLPVALYTRVTLGGIGYTASQISLYMSAQAASQSLWFLIAFPWLQRRIGTKGVLHLCSIAYPIFFLCFIVMNALLREGSETSIIWFWIITFFSAFVGPAVFMSNSAAQLVINDVSPDPRMLARVNTIALMLMNMIRIAAPGAATAVYAAGVHGQLLGGYLGWLVFSVASTGLYIAHKQLPDRSPSKSGH